ncbi:MAG: hypothetical protein Q3978_04750 [Limosilactobacillus gorillae]|nr:hypothetical protein [Limosilactobacillus gorillae]
MTPQEGERLKKATQALDQGRLTDGIKLLQDLDQEVDDFAVNRLLSKALFDEQRYVEAYQVASRHLGDYDQSHELAHFFVQLTIKNQFFIPARRFINLAAHLNDDELALVDQAEKLFTQMGTQVLASRRRQFIHMGDYSFREQERRFNDGQKIPLSDYLVGTKFLLRDPDTHPLIKSSLVQSLQPLHLNEEVTMLWIDEKEYSLNLAQLKPLGNFVVVKEGERLLSERYQDQDPLSYRTYLQEFYLQLTFLYPFVERAVLNAEAWIKALVAYSTTGNEEAVLQAHRWQERINSLVARLG